jgi:transposase
MDVIVQRCAGLDVHRDTVVATVRTPGPRDGRRAQETRTFATHVADLVALQQWLATQAVTLVAMEATGVYWKPVFQVLEERFCCWLLNAQHLRNVPGRKTDVSDSVWITQLVEHGLVRPSFVPPAPIRALRDLTRHRRTMLEERTRTIQRVEKVLQDAGIKLTSVASKLLTKSGRDILDALIAGQTDPTVLAELARGSMRSKIPALRTALAGRFRAEHHGPLVAQLLAHIDGLDQAIADLDTRIAQALVPYQSTLELVLTIPGIGRRTAEALIAECGVDMSVFPTVGHFASWAGICPGNNASGGKRKSGHTRKGPVWLRTALTEAAQAVARSKGTYFAAHHAQIRGRRGSKKAIGATRHDLLVAYYHVVRDQLPFRDLGADWAARRFSVEHRTRRLVRQLEQLGHKVTVEPAA